ncbi:phage tail tape measure protein [Citrobacter freundii]|uniref:phage tail tape measure protein n=1 Tax=Citrobacter freundii TaxID=546 RepID=UPI0033546A27
MATLRELIIKISANSQSFQAEISRASRMGQDYYRTMQNGGRQAAAASRETQRALADLTGQLNSAKASAVGLAGAFAGAYATGHLISLADEWSSVNARLKQASQSTDDFNESQRALMEISQRTGTAFSDNASLFARSAASMREYGYSSEEVLKVTEAISTGLKLSGASSSEASSVITQFSQALAQGVLRGEEFNSVNENGDRVIRALASGMGVARKDLKAMADQGQLTADKVVPALISQLGKLKSEFDAMPNSVSAASTRIQNAFMEWVGGANQASGATATISGVMDSAAKNIDTVATAAGVLVAVGVARYFGNWTSSIATNTGELIKNYQSQVNNAAAQLNAAQVTQRKALANAEATASAYNLARAEANAAKGTNASTLATQNAIQKRKEMIAANALLVQSNRAVTASEASLNRMTSATTLLGRGFSMLGSLVGGIPGAVMLGAAAWYYVYQKQEQARESALQYANTIDTVRQSLNKMSSVQIGSNLGSARLSLTEQSRLIDEQENKLQKLRLANEAAQATVENAKNGLMVFTDVNAHAARTSAELAIEEGKLEQMISKRNETQKLISDLTVESINKTVEMTGAVGSLADMYERLNKVTRQTTLLTPPSFAGMSLPALDDKQQAAITKMERNRIRSGLKGKDLARQEAQWDIDDQALPPGWAQRYMSDALQAFDQTEANKPKKKGGKTEGEKTEDVYKRLIKQQKEQIALQGQNTELAKVKYQVSQGELASLTEAQKKTLLQNAGLIDQVKLREQLRNYESNLADSNASASAANEAQLIGYGQGTRFRERMQEQFNIRKEFEQKNTDLLRQRQADQINEAVYQQELALNKRYLEERLRDQEGYYAASDAQRDDWITGLSEGYANWVDEATDYSAMAADGMKQAMGGAVTSITDMLNGNVDSWKDWGVSVLKIIENVAINMALAKGVSSLGSFFSFGASSAASASSGTAIQNAGANFTFNAKGNVYDSPSLSAYSNGVFQTPQLFAFAKGAGVFAEAGPEAIMPLTRAADGSLGVRAVGTPQVSGGVPSVNFGDINIQGGSPQAVSQGTAGAAGRQLKDAVTGVINEQASMPGSPLWRLIKGV